MSAAPLEEKDPRRRRLAPLCCLREQAQAASLGNNQDVWPRRSLDDHGIILLVSPFKLLTINTLDHGCYIYNVHHSYKSGNLRQTEGSKRQKYLEHYQQQRYVLSPMVANSLGQCGPDCRKFLLLTADHAAQTQYDFSLDDVNNNCLNEHI